MPRADRIRVVLFGGAYLDRGAERFLVALNEHPQIEFLAALCQSAGMEFGDRVANLWQRRRLMALPILGYEFSRSCVERLRHPRSAAAFAWRLRAARRKIIAVPDLHAPEALDRLRKLDPDLGVIYGSPLLKPEVYRIPRLGTLGIHHGKVPEYRGKKTTFWAMMNGERTAGVTIQRINEGIDTGDVLKVGEVTIGRKSYRRVEAELDQLGCEIYIDAILDVKAGRATPLPQQASTFHLPRYRQPSAGDVLRFLWRRVYGLQRSDSTATDDQRGNASAEKQRSTASGRRV